MEKSFCRTRCCTPFIWESYQLSNGNPPLYHLAFCVISYESWHCITRCCLFVWFVGWEPFVISALCILCTYIFALVVHSYITYTQRGLSGFSCSIEFDLESFDFDWRSVFYGVCSLFFLMRKSPWNIEKMMPRYTIHRLK